MSYTRKVQKIGASLFVSLPKSWAKRVRLDRGSAVDMVEQSDGSIILYSEVRSDKAEMTTVHVKQDESVRSLRRKITGLYVDGFDLIELGAEEKFSDEQQDAIREIAQALFGLEIVEAMPNLIVIQCLLTKTLPIEKTIKRIHVMVNSMLNETVSALKERNPSAAKSATRNIRDVERLSLVVHRLLRSQMLFPTKRSPGLKPIDSVDFLRVLDKIVEVTGSGKKIAQSVSRMLEQPPPISILNPLLGPWSNVLDTYNLSMQSLMSNDIQLANDVLDRSIDRSIDNLMELLVEEEKSKISYSTFSCIHRIVDNLGQILSYSMEIAEIAIDRAEESS